jgi:adenosylcobyric acid synthase
VFAAFVGTLELLEPDERARIAGFVVNKFRGDLALLQPGLDFLTARTGKPVVGVLPYLRDLRLPDEDSVSLEGRAHRAAPGRDRLDVAVIRLPRISNHDDVEPLEHEPGVVVRFVAHPDEARTADLLILPGSKSTMPDLAWLRSRGFAELVEARARSGVPVLGICGGCQMLGASLDDPHGVESAERSVAGLGLLPLRTTFGPEKLTADVVAEVATPSFLSDHAPLAARVQGYEIHMGQVEALPGARAPFQLVTRNGRPAPVADGAIGEGGTVVGTMLHGLFRDDALRAALLAVARRRRGLAAPPSAQAIPSQEAGYDRLAAAVREHLDCGLLDRLAR